MVVIRRLFVWAAVLLSQAELVRAEDDEQPPAPPPEENDEDEEADPPPPPPVKEDASAPPVIDPPPAPPPPPVADESSDTSVLSTSTLTPKKSQAEIDELLHVAANNQMIDLVTDLLSQRANVNNQDTHGWTPLHCTLMHAAKRGHDPSPVIDLLMTNKADVNIVDTRGRPPLFFAAKTGRGHILDRYFKDVKDPNPGNLVLRHATEAGHGEVASRLLAMGADTDVGTFDIHLMRRLKGLVKSQKDAKLPEHMVRRLQEVPDEALPRAQQSLSGSSHSDTPKGDDL